MATDPETLVDVLPTAASATLDPALDSTTRDAANEHEVDSSSSSKSAPPTSLTMSLADLDPAEAMVAIGNNVLMNGGAPSSSSSTEPATPASESGDGDHKLSFHNHDDDGEDFQDALEDLPLTSKLNKRLSMYSPQVRESQEWEQIMQDWDRVMAEKRIQDARLHLVEQENKRMKSQLVDSETARAELEKETKEKTEALEKEVKQLKQAAKDPAKEKKRLMNQLEECEAEKELFKLMLEETEGEKKRVEVRLNQLDKERETWDRKKEKIRALRDRLRVSAAKYSLLSTSTSQLLESDVDGVKPNKERKRLLAQVQSLETDRSRLAALVKDTMSGKADTIDQEVSIEATVQLVNENKRLSQELEMAKVENSLLQRRIEAFEVSLHDVRVALTNSEAHIESLEVKKYDQQEKVSALETNLDRTRNESNKYQALHKEALEKSERAEREIQVIKARFEAKDRVLITTQKQLAAAKADGGLLKTIRRELESVLFDYNTVVQHFMDIQVQAIGAKSLANTYKRQINELQAQLTHYRTMLLGIKSFNNNDPIRSPTVATLRSEFRVLLEKLQEEQNKQVERERGDKFKAQDWNRKLRMEKDFMKLELQNQIEKWRRVSIYWEDKWRKTANDLHEAVTAGTSSDLLFEVASANGVVGATDPHHHNANADPSTAAKRRSLAISTLNHLGSGGIGSHDQPMTPSAMKQHLMETSTKRTSTGSLSRSNSVPASALSPTMSSFSSSSIASPTAISSTSLSSSSFHASSSSSSSSTTGNTLTDIVSQVKPFISRSLSQTSAVTSSLIGGVGTGRGGPPSSPSSRLSAAQSLRTPIAAGLPSNVVGTGAMGGLTATGANLNSAAASRSRSMATSAIGSARTQALRAGVPTSVANSAAQEAQTRATSSIASTSRQVDQTLSESDQLKAEIRRMLSR
ncbi:hypothetical protein DFQ26_004359 [Actinomortierella ambigua]|nr:hypothetical protein DFQ26_004359 [Actinomortierella ambigua]